MMGFALRLRVALVLCCSACRQDHDNRVAAVGMPRSPDQVLPKACLAFGICPCCGRILDPAVDRAALSSRLIRMGFAVDPVVVKCPPGSAALPWDWA